MKNLLYVKEKEYSAVITYSDYTENCLSINTFITTRLKQKFVSYQFYKKYIKRYLNISKNAPIYIDSKEILFHLNDSKTQEKYLINYNNIANICYDEGHATIVFYDGNMLDIHVKRETVKTNIKKVKDVISYFLQ